LDVKEEVIATHSMNLFKWSDGFFSKDGDSYRKKKEVASVGNHFSYKFPLAKHGSEIQIK